MSEKTKEVKNFQDTMYTYSLHGETIHISTFDNQSMSIGCVGKLGHLFGFLQHYFSLHQMKVRFGQDEDSKPSGG